MKTIKKRKLWAFLDETHQFVIGRREALHLSHRLLNRVDSIINDEKMTNSERGKRAMKIAKKARGSLDMYFPGPTGIDVEKLRGELRDFCSDCWDDIHMTEQVLKDAHFLWATEKWTAEHEKKFRKLRDKILKEEEK